MNSSYLSFNQFLKATFGERVQKIPLDAGLGCPNRDGSKGRGGCIYCDPRGSGTGAAAQGLSIKAQMERGIEWVTKRYKARRYLPYFQSFSNTYAPTPVLEKLYCEAIDFDGIAGIAIATRPDCVTQEVLDMIGQVTSGRMVWMEYGLQSANNETLERINRGHTVEDFIKCVNMTMDAGFLICAHVIFGLPGQSKKEMMDTVKLLADLGVQGIKFHNLYILKGTRLFQMYENRPFPLLKQEEYAGLVAKAIRILPKGTVIQRLTGDPPPHAGTALPLWSHDKHRTLNLIQKEIERS